MYETQSIDDLHKKILDNISNDYRKLQGYPTYDLTRGFAFGIKDSYDLAAETKWKQDIENLTGSELNLFIEERTGLERKKAVKSKGQLRIVEGNGSILKGDLFATKFGVQFVATESKEVHANDLVMIESVVGGEFNNVEANTIVEMPVTLQGISKVTNPEAMTGGYDAETDNDYRNRYYQKLRTPVNGVNANQYIVWAESLDGVGKARCVPIWQGKNTVKVIIIGNDFKPASEDLVTRVQNYIDPNKNGDGAGVATIGAVTTVVSATSVPITVQIKGLKVAKESLLETTKEAIKTNIDRYVRTSAFNTDYVSLAKIGMVIAETDNVNDFAEVRVNNGHTSVTMENEQCAVLTEVTYE